MKKYELERNGEKQKNVCIVVLMISRAVLSYAKVTWVGSRHLFKRGLDIKGMKGNNTCVWVSKYISDNLITVTTFTYAIIMIII